MSLSPGELRRRSWSIVARLALLYTLVSTVVLCVAGLFLYWSLVQSLRSEERNTLADKIAVLRRILLERPEDRNALEEEVEWESTARRQSVYYARLILRGRTIATSTSVLLLSKNGRNLIRLIRAIRIFFRVQQMQALSMVLATTIFRRVTSGMQSGEPAKHSATMDTIATRQSISCRTVSQHHWSATLFPSISELLFHRVPPSSTRLTPTSAALIPPSPISGGRRNGNENSIITSKKMISQRSRWCA